MARPLYYIDWEDEAYPKIRPLPHDPGKVGLDDSDGMTFGAAKKELLEDLRHKRDHWQALIKYTKEVTEAEAKGNTK